MEKKYVIAFDQGTTSTRAILFDKLYGINIQENQSIRRSFGLIKEQSQYVRSCVNRDLRDILPNTQVL